MRVESLLKEFKWICLFSTRIEKKIQSMKFCMEFFSLQVLDSRGYLLTALGHGLWPSMVLLSEIVQTFILADFCYYYVKRCVLWLKE